MTNFPYVPTEYSTKPGLKKLEDEKHFIIDEMLPLYKNEKEDARLENLGKYYRERETTKNTAFADIHKGNQDFLMKTITMWMAEQLEKEYEHIEFRNEGKYYVLDNEITGESVWVDEKLKVVQILKSPICTCSKKCSGCDYPMPYVNLFDALCSQIQEDVCIMQNDELVASHVCLPSWWSVEEKMGANMAQIHSKVPGMNDTSYKQIWNACLNKGPFIRFNWGLTDTMILNQHPTKSIGKDFDKENLYLRIERQVLRGFPVIKSVLFLIRTFVADVKTLTKEQRATMVTAIENMTDEELEYKGLTDKRERVILSCGE